MDFSVGSSGKVSAVLFSRALFTDSSHCEDTHRAAGSCCDCSCVSFFVVGLGMAS